jgi:hypothetical protein
LIPVIAAVQGTLLVAITGATNIAIAIKATAITKTFPFMSFTSSYILTLGVSFVSETRERK